MVGFDLLDDERIQLGIIDPGDNIADDLGVHLWDASPAMHPLEFDADGWILGCPDRRARVFGAVIVSRGHLQAPMQRKHIWPQLTDLSQHRVDGWKNYCAPTDAADVIYFLARRDSLLLRDISFGPGEAADTGATAMIAGTESVPADGSLADLIATGRESRTSPADLRDGLAAFLADDGGDRPWSVRWLTNSNGTSHGLGFLHTLCRHVQSGDGVILALHWVYGATMTIVWKTTNATEHAGPRSPRPETGSLTGEREPSNHNGSTQGRTPMRCIIAKTTGFRPKCAMVLARQVVRVRCYLWRALMISRAFLNRSLNR